MLVFYDNKTKPLAPPPPASDSRPEKLGSATAALEKYRRTDPPANIATAADVHPMPWWWAAALGLLIGLMIWSWAAGGGGAIAPGLPFFGGGQ